jgi:carbon-monoxide dehydrogenase large subunit
VDIAAARLGLDRVEIRRRNMIQPDEMPFRTGLTFTYDSGDFPAVLDRALVLADWAGFSGRRKEAAARGRLRGLGLACPIEIAGGPFRQPMPEFAGLAFEADGTAVLKVGSMDSGQGHATVFRQILAERAGLDPARVRVVMGDTEAIPKGLGTFGSRTMSAAGTAIARGVDRLIELARPLAADMLETAPADLEFAEGGFQVIGTDRRVSLATLGAQHADTLCVEEFSAALDATFPNGCHLCEVEVDPETGQVAVLAYVVVDDVGTVVNPALLKGQIQGGVAQGLGQALLEEMVYDPETGQVLTGSFQDYGMPRADDMPMIAVEAYPVPTATNPLGVKGAGEAGVVGALPAVINALVDALSPLGVTHLDMPVTPERLWRALAAAKAA